MVTKTRSLMKRHCLAGSSNHKGGVPLAWDPELWETGSCQVLMAQGNVDELDSANAEKNLQIGFSCCSGLCSSGGENVLLEWCSQELHTQDRKWTIRGNEIFLLPPPGSQSPSTTVYWQDVAWVYLATQMCSWHNLSFSVTKLTTEGWSGGW